MVNKKIGLLMGVCMLGMLSACGGGATEAVSTGALEASTLSTAAESLTEASAAAGTEASTEAVSSATLSTQKSAEELVKVNEQGQIVVTHKYGETVMPENPQKIVSIKLEDILLALDVPMVAARNFEGFYLEEELKARNVAEIAVDEEANTINMEQVMSFQPDLIIIRDSFDQAVYDELSKIAPTVAFDLKKPTTALLAAGKALGMEDKAIARLEQYGAKVEETKTAIKGKADESVAMLRVMKKEIRLYPETSNDMSAFLYVDLGMKAPALTREYDTKDNFAISMELLPDLDAEHIFLVAGYGTLPANEDAAAISRYEEIKGDPLWQTIPAVKSGKVYEVDSRIWLTHGIIAREMKMDDIVKYLGE